MATTAGSGRGVMNPPSFMGRPGAPHNQMGQIHAATMAKSAAKLTQAGIGVYSAERYSARSQRNHP